MFPFFEPKPSIDQFHSTTYDLTAPLPLAIAATATVIDSKLKESRHWASKARKSLTRGEVDKYISFIRLARETSREATALMEAADILHEEILSQAV